jgi:sterol desaturase/sphingolipid hydroxylase (fatty acid hydroxylase superfamily)
MVEGGYMSKNDVTDGVNSFGINLMDSETAYSPGMCLLVAFILFSALELSFPWRQWPLAVLQRSYMVNIGIFVINNLVLPLLSVSTLLALAERYSGSSLLDGLPPLTQAVLSLLLFDLTLYFWHWISHKFAWLWQFHRVHHSDPTMNVSTAFRVHMLDHLTMMGFKLAYVIGFGVSKETLVWNEAITTLFLMFHHSNLTFKGEGILGHLVIVPYLHRLHHSTQRREHDSNYGAVLSVWDRLFGTLKEGQPENLGIKEAFPQGLPGLIMTGFWGMTTKSVNIAKLGELDDMVAVAAYYRAEKRNFLPGNDIKDWLEAKQEIIKQVYGKKPKHSSKKSRSQTAYSIQQVCC